MQEVMEYYEWRRKAIADMRYEYRMTLEEIGRHFGVSRERVRQILELVKDEREGVINEFGLSARTINNKKWLEEHFHLTNNEIAQKTGFDSNTVSKKRVRQFHAADGYNQSVHYDAVMLTCDKLRMYNIKFKTQGRYVPQDIVAIGKRKAHLAVSGSTKPKTSPTTMAATSTTVYRFNVAPKLDNREKLDFFIFVTMIEGEENHFFVIPRERMTQSIKSQICISYPAKRKAYNRLEIYHDRWDLILDHIN